MQQVISAIAGGLIFTGEDPGFPCWAWEIEVCAREFMKTHAVVAIARQNEAGLANLSLHWKLPGSTEELNNHLKESLPSYMLPAKILVQEFSVEPEWKTDRKSIDAGVNL